MLGKRKNRMALLLYFFAIFITFSAIGAAHAAETVKIGAVLPLSGGVAGAASWVVDGVKMSVDDINARGGIQVQGKGYKIDLVLYDSKCEPAPGVAAVEKLVSRDKVIGVIGDYCSHCTLAQREITNRNKIVQITPSSVHPKITAPEFPYIFRITNTMDVIAGGFVKFIVKKLPIKNVAFLAITDDYGRSAVDRYSQLFPNNGIKIIGVEYFKHGDTDFYTQITKLLAGTPEAIYIVTDEDSQSIGTLKQLKELGFKGNIFGSSTFATDNILKLGGKQLLEGMYLETTSFEIVRNEPNVQEWLKRYYSKFGRVGNEFVYEGYLALELLAKGIESANTLTDKEKIREGVSKLDLNTLTAFHGEPRLNDVGQMRRYQGALQYKDGKMIVVYSEKEK